MKIKNKNIVDITCFPPSSVEAGIRGSGERNPEESCGAKFIDTGSIGQELGHKQGTFSGLGIGHYARSEQVHIFQSIN